MLQVGTNIAFGINTSNIGSATHQLCNRGWVHLCLPQFLYNAYSGEDQWEIVYAVLISLSMSHSMLNGVLTWWGNIFNWWWKQYATTLISHISLNSIIRRHTFYRLYSTQVKFFISLNFSWRQCLNLNFSWINLIF